MDEIHFVSTIPYNEEMVETNLSCSNQCPQVIGNGTMQFQIRVELRLDKVVFSTLVLFILVH